MSDESQSPGVSVELIGAFYEVLGRRFPNRADLRNTALKERTDATN